MACASVAKICKLTPSLSATLAGLVWASAGKNRSFCQFSQPLHSFLAARLGVPTAVSGCKSCHESDGVNGLADDAAYQVNTFVFEGGHFKPLLPCAAPGARTSLSLAWWVLVQGIIVSIQS